MIDSGTPGSGKVFDWSLAEGAPSHRRVILAGGLTAENVTSAIERVRPWGVDVVTGVESSPGRKDPARCERSFSPPGRPNPMPTRAGPRPLRLAGGRGSGPSAGGRGLRGRGTQGTDARERDGRALGGGALRGVRGRFIPETLVPACEELERAFRVAWADPAFRSELDRLLRDYAGRPTPLTDCTRVSEELGLRLLLKREDLTHTGSHKINNVVGQALLAQRMGKTRLVAETGAGQHGVATATAAALFGMECCVYMGEVDMERQALNVFRMRLLGAEVRGVSSGSRTLKDAVNEALRDWVATVETTHYCLGSVMGPHPYPWLVRELQRVLGDEARTQCEELLGDVPDIVTACVGGGSNATGIFTGFVDTRSMLVGVEPRGGAAIGRGVPGVVHGSMSFLLQDEHGQVREAQSISAGLDYPGVGPEHATWPTAGEPDTSRSTTRRSWTRSACCPGPRASSPRSSRRTPWRGSPGPGPTWRTRLCC